MPKKKANVERKRRKWDCLFCFKNAEVDKSNGECTESMFNSCFRHLSSDVIDLPKTFEEFQSNHGPFCVICFQAAQQLSKKNEFLATVEKEIKHFVTSLTDSILQNRNSSVNTPFEFQSSVIVIEEECNYSVEVVEANSPGPVDEVQCYMEVQEVETEEQIDHADSSNNDAEHLNCESESPVTASKASSQDTKNEPIMRKIVMQKNDDGKIVMTIPCDCGLSFDNAEELKDHTFSCSASKIENDADASQFSVKYRCGVCGFLAETMPDLKKHKIRHIKKYPCKECDEKFRRKYQLEEHIIAVHREPKFTCQVCDRLFKTRKSLKLHKKAMHKAEPDKIEDKDCLEEEQVKRIKLKHEERQCDLCGVVFRSKTHLNYHVIIKHTDETPYECKHCDRKFKIRRFLNTHMQTHKKVKDYLCAEDGCGKSFPSLLHLKKHTRLEHSDDHFKCEYCGHKTLNEKRMNVHKAHFHDLNKKFACDICGIRVSALSTLRNHERIHTGEKPFKCNICGESFRTTVYLNIHNNRMHSDGKFKCPQCDYVAGSNYMLSTHSLVHSDHKPFSCEYCGKRYKTKFAVLEHHIESCKMQN